MTMTVLCPCCEQRSTVSYRCDNCGRDLAGEEGRER